MTENEARAILEVDDLIRDLERSVLYFPQEYYKNWSKLVCDACDVLEMVEPNDD